MNIMTWCAYCGSPVPNHHNAGCPVTAAPQKPFNNTQLMSDYRSAYEAVNNKPAPSIGWANGWFKVGPSRYRYKTLERMLGTLQSRLSSIIDASETKSQ